MEKIIINSMKKVFLEELKELENELNQILKKYNVKNKDELERKISNGEIKEDDIKDDLERIEFLEENIERVMKCLREINVKSL
jgi:TRAP-type C4-dicarboxylate transport system substrate-binding protein